jgi:hypothetical protein
VYCTLLYLCSVANVIAFVLEKTGSVGGRTLMMYMYSTVQISVNYTAWIIIVFIIFSDTAAQGGLWPPRPRDFLITHDAPHPVGLLLTSDQLVAETSI